MLDIINIFLFLFYSKICVQKVPILGVNFPYFLVGGGGDYNSVWESNFSSRFLIFPPVFTDH